MFIKFIKGKQTYGKGLNGHSGSVIFAENVLKKWANPHTVISMCFLKYPSLGYA